MLQLVIPRRGFLLARRNRVDVRRGGVVGQIGAGPARLLDELLENVMGALRAFHVEDAVERLEPFLSLLWIDIGQSSHLHGRPFEVQLTAMHL